MRSFGARRSRRRAVRAGSGARLELARQRFGPAAGFSFDRAHPYAAGQHRGIDIGAAEGVAVSAPVVGDGLLRGDSSELGQDDLDRDERRLLGHARSPRLVLGETRTAGRRARRRRHGRPERAEAELPEPYVYLGVARGSDPQGYVDPLLVPARRGRPPRRRRPRRPRRGARASASTGSGAGRRSGSAGRRASAAAGTGCAVPTAALRQCDARRPRRLRQRSRRSRLARHGAGTGDGGQATRAAHRNRTRADPSHAQLHRSARARQRHGPVRRRASEALPATRGASISCRMPWQRRPARRPFRLQGRARAGGNGSGAGSGIGPRPPARDRAAHGARSRRPAERKAARIIDERCAST